jgi:hypothetical protein
VNAPSPGFLDRTAAVALLAACLFLAPQLACSAHASEASRATPWALQPIVRPVIPAVRTSAARNPVDAFVFAKLDALHLAPAPEADRRTLIRRLTFDLIGLPPTPEEVRAFEQDKSPKAYETLVERLLASPRFGERWARHWLDVVRFAETTGFEVNTPRPNAWPYRDYVIRAFNEDVPYDRFILEQLAGDALGADPATGFLVAGPDDKVKSPDPVLTANQRADEMHDMVSTTSSAFLGLTVGCARCHDHKFDPIPQTEYYALKACLAGVQHGDRKLKTPEAEAMQQEAELRRRRLAEIDSLLAGFEPLAQVGAVLDTHRLRAPVNPRLNVERFPAVTARWLRFTISRTSDAEPCLDELEVYTAEAQPRNIALASAGTRARASSVYPNSEIHRLEHVNDGRYGNARSWISNERGRGWIELEFSAAAMIDRVLWGRDREQRYTDRLALDYRIEVAMVSNEWRVVASALDRPTYAPGQKANLLVAGLPSAEAARVQALLAERAEHEARLKELANSPMVYGGLFQAQPAVTHRLHRGDAMEPRDVIEPGALSVMPIPFDLGADTRAAPAALTTDQQRRLALARWIVHPANPLPARVLVNRLWHYHFGAGLVRTPSDFGAMGALPSHPELLDWLAAEFQARGWSLKAIHRLIVTSATYRQSSAARAEGLKLDAEARWLWRFPPRRLEAEPIRDAILAVSGRLDLKMGGPGWSAFEPNDNYVRVYHPKKEFGPAERRRMIYMTQVRMQQDGTFGAFDCPDGAQIAPTRSRSTTPLQALNLLNSSFIMQQAGFFAERLEKDAGPDRPVQIRRGFFLAFGREPDRRELTASTDLIREHGLLSFCRALLNANEFVFLE